MLAQGLRKRILPPAKARGAKLLVLALLAGGVMTQGASAQDHQSFSGSPLWAKEVRSYAEKSLKSSEGLSVAAIPLNGPGIDQYVNADRLMSPGSIMKLVTTYAALELLGPNYRWTTDFLTDGTMTGDTLEGNLYVRFSGDPKLTIERLWTTLAELRAMGINRITGDLVLDGNRFRVDGGFPQFDDSGDDPYAPFLVEPSAYLTNLNLQHFQVRSDERGTRAWSVPDLQEVTIDNQVTTLPEGPCPARRNFDWTPVFHDGNQITVRVTGALPQGCRTSKYLSLLSQEQYSASMIRSILSDSGVHIEGGNRLAQVPEDARLVMRTRSPDLVAMVRDVNKWSSNVMARQLLLNIGAELRQESDQDDRVAGIKAIYSWLENKGVNTAGMVIDNGSGLTRHGRITARQGADILQHAWNSPFAADLMASLPIIAMDGTMASRLKNTGLDGKGRIKTGLLANVRSIAGFSRDENNTTWAVVGMVNNDPAWNGKAVLDRVLYSLHFQPPTGTTISRSGATSASSIQ